MAGRKSILKKALERGKGAPRKKNTVPYPAAGGDIPCGFFTLLWGKIVDKLWKNKIGRTPDAWTLPSNKRCSQSRRFFARFKVLRFRVAEKKDFWV